MKLREMIEKLLRTRYICALEEEIARLRAENRALLNSILGVAGMPPLSRETLRATLSREPARPEAAIGASAAADAPAEETPFWRRWRKFAHHASGSHAGPAGPPHAMRARGLRRRSWHQVGRALEIEDVRRMLARPGRIRGPQVPGKKGLPGPRQGEPGRKTSLGDQSIPGDKTSLRNPSVSTPVQEEHL